MVFGNEYIAGKEVNDDYWAEGHEGLRLFHDGRSNISIPAVPSASSGRWEWAPEPPEPEDPLYPRPPSPEPKVAAVSTSSAAPTAQTVVTEPAASTTAPPTSIAATPAASTEAGTTAPTTRTEEWFACPVPVEKATITPGSSLLSIVQPEYITDGTEVDGTKVSRPVVTIPPHPPIVI